MRPFILNLADSQAVLETVGGKGMSLARMLNAGLPVPGGFHVTTEAYRYFVAENDIQTRILGALKDLDTTDLARLESVSHDIRLFFANGRLPINVAEDISTAYSRLDQLPVAVRSSATAEDLPDASFAGQQETYLNICGVEAVQKAIIDCWASLWTGRAIAYRSKNNIDQDTVALAVVVQQMVFADAAGILFTANPINGSRNELVINASWGLGEAVVAGVVTPDAITVRKDTGRILQRKIAEKLVMTIRTDSGTNEVPVPKSKRKKATLSASQTIVLAHLGIQIEQFYGIPMDVEWALANSRFAILQARPITALPLEWKVPTAGAIVVRGSLAEHTPSPVTPLFATFGLEIANTATAQLWKQMFGKADQSLMVGDGYYLPINGYLYGGMRMGIGDLFTILRLSALQIGIVFHGSVDRWQVARQEFAKVVDKWQQKPPESLSPAELLEEARAIFSASCHYFTQIQTALPAASMSEVIFSRFYNSLYRRKQDPEPTVYLVGFDTISSQAEKSLYDISLWVRDHPIFSDYLVKTPTTGLVTNLQAACAPAGLPDDLWEEWRVRFQRHLEEYGRTAYELDFANATPMETPGPLLDTMKGFLDGKAQNPYTRQREMIEKREAATHAVLARVGWPRKSWFKKVLHWAQDNAPMREDCIFDMGMGHPLLRRIFYELGCRFAASGAIAKAGDIYWLEKAEVEELVVRMENGQPLPDMAERIPKRKAQWQAYLKINPPVMLPEKSGWSKLLQGGDAKRKDGKVVLKGVGTSQGKITAPACVLFGPKDFGKIKPGDVLVAVTTTPAWTPLFSMASAVVTDIGGPLSHSSIIAREYGIPAVMAAHTATRAIQTGQLITVDGAAGTVTLE